VQLKVHWIKLDINTFGKLQCVRSETVNVLFINTYEKISSIDSMCSSHGCILCIDAIILPILRQFKWLLHNALAVLNEFTCS